MFEFVRLSAPFVRENDGNRENLVFVENWNVQLSQWFACASSLRQAPHV
ncbi:hypothetical protein OCEANICA350_20063 [Oceanicaulis sp. 350]|nr:hypothetical protein OCEANICA350_20063 [Oceanicaulis sp. 350]